MSPDEQFSHYKIMDRLGRGGMATVYKAEDIRTNQIVALKILHDRYSTDSEIIQRFNREADIFYRLKHPNIVPIIDHGSKDGTFYIAMEYMAHGTLSESFNDPREVDVEFTIDILTKIADALDYAHQQGVVHRDLKLENILLDEHNTPYLADFGIAFLTDATRLTSHETSPGTPMYMSPEQVVGLDVTSLSDLYSLAVMAYLMTTGYHPFTNKDPYIILYQHVSQPPPVPTTVNETLSHAVNAVLLRGLEKEPDKRFTTATEFVIALADALDQDNFKTQTYVRLTAPNPQAIKTIDEYKDTVIGGVKPFPTAPSATSESSTSKTASNSNRRLIIGGLVLIAVLVVGLILFLSIEDDEEAELAIAQTQVRLEIELELTGTAQAISEIIPIGTISQQGGTGMRDSPERGSQELARLQFGETVNLIGRSTPGDFIEVVTTDGLSGFVKFDQIETIIDVMSLPITYRRPPNDSQNHECNNASPFGYLIADDTPILADTNLDAEVLMTRPIEDRLRLIGRDANSDFIEVEVNDADKTRGFILREQFTTDEDLSCLPEIP